LLPDQRLPAGPDGPRPDPDLREPESRGEPPRGTDLVLSPGLPVQRRAVERRLRPDADGAGGPALPPVGRTAEGFRPDRSGATVPEVRRHVGPDRDHGERGDHLPEQTGPQPPAERGWTDPAHGPRAVVGRTSRTPGVPLTAADSNPPPSGGMGRPPTEGPRAVECQLGTLPPPRESALNSARMDESSFRVRAHGLHTRLILPWNTGRSPMLPSSAMDIPPPRSGMTAGCWLWLRPGG